MGRKAGIESNSPVGASFPFNDFIKARLILVYPEIGLCDPLLSSELEYISFVRQLLKHIKQKKHHPISVLGKLHAGEMDEEGRFYVLDNLAKVKRGIVQYKQERKQLCQYTTW